MNQAEFGRFIKLVELDKELYHLNFEQANLICQIEQLELDIENIQRDVEKAHRNIIDLKKHNDFLALELKAINTKEEEKKNRIDNAATTKEYYLLEQELENLKKRKIEIEESIFTLWQKLETAEQEYESIISNAREHKENLVNDINSFRRRVDYLGNQILELSNLRAQVQQEVSQEFLDQYNTMKESVSNPVVPVSQNSCSVCFFIITNQDLSQLRQGKLARCKDCYRLLYLPQTATTEIQ